MKNKNTNKKNNDINKKKIINFDNKSYDFDIYSTLKKSNKLFCYNCKTLLKIPFKKKIVEVVCLNCNSKINLKKIRKSNNHFKNLKKKYHWLIKFLKYIKRN